MCYAQALGIAPSVSSCSAYRALAPDIWAVSTITELYGECNSLVEIRGQTLSLSLSDPVGNNWTRGYNATAFYDCPP